MRKTLDFIYSDSDESLGTPDPQEIKESIAEYERRSLAAHSEGLLKNIRKAVENAKLCLSNNDFSNPILSHMALIKKEQTIPEEQMQKQFGDELDELIDEDFLQSTPKTETKQEKNEQAVETLQDELRELYDNFEDDELFNNEDNDSQNCTPRGYSNLKSITTKNGSSKRIPKDSYGVYEENELDGRENRDNELPFAVADELIDEKESSSKKVEDYIVHEEVKDIHPKYEEKGKQESKINLVSLNIPQIKEKRAESTHNTPQKPENIRNNFQEICKKKLKSLSRDGSVIRKYSAERFKGSS